MKYYIMLISTHPLLTPLHPITPPSLNPPPPHTLLSLNRYKVDIHLNWATMKYYIMLTPTHPLLTPLHPINPPSLTLSTHPLNPPSLNPPPPLPLNH